jgi:hypothetical protein
VLGFGERSGGERAAAERGGGRAGRVQAVAGGGGGITVVLDGRLASGVAAVPHYRVRVWGVGDFHLPAVEGVQGATGGPVAGGGAVGWRSSKGTGTAAGGR